MKRMNNYYFAFSHSGGFGCRNFDLPYKPPFTPDEIREICKAIEHFTATENVFIINYFPIRTKKRRQTEWLKK